MSVRPKPSLRACRARPSRGGQSKLGWPRGENPGITRRAVFSEGRTLCVRFARPHKCQGIPFPPLDDARGRLPYRTHVSVNPTPPLRACGARQSALFPQSPFTSIGHFRQTNFLATGPLLVYLTKGPFLDESTRGCIQRKLRPRKKQYPGKGQLP